MNKSIIYVVLISIIILLTGCPGSVDSIAWKDLGHGYIYHEPGGLPYIEKEYSDKGIPGYISDYKFNDEFIIALEKDAQLSEEKRNELILRGDFYDYLSKNGNSKYWIIAHANDSIYGPMQRYEYEKKREELKVPGELVLKEKQSE